MSKKSADDGKIEAEKLKSEEVAAKNTKSESATSSARKIINVDSRKAKKIEMDPKEERKETGKSSTSDQMKSKKEEEAKAQKMVEEAQKKLSVSSKNSIVSKSSLRNDKNKDKTRPKKTVEIMEDSKIQNKRENEKKISEKGKAKRTITMKMTLEASGIPDVQMARSRLFEGLRPHVTSHKGFMERMEKRNQPRRVRSASAGMKSSSSQSKIIKKEKPRKRAKSTSRVAEKPKSKEDQRMIVEKGSAGNPRNNERHNKKTNNENKVLEESKNFKANEKESFLSKRANGELTK